MNLEALLEEVSPTLVEYGVRELFKGKSIKSAARVVVKKFNGAQNLFLGYVSVTPEEMEEALWDRLVSQAMKAVGHLKPGFEDKAILGTLDFFKQPESLLPELKRRMGITEAETIAGNLCRADDGEFSACGTASSSPAKTTHRKAARTDVDIPAKEKTTREIAKKLDVDWEKLNFSELENMLKEVDKEGGKSDLCILDPPLCKDCFGIDRKEMPQFPKERVHEFMDALKKDGLRRGSETRTAK